MQGILLDNWCIENIISCINDNEQKAYNKEYIDFLAAIVLWDDLYYPENTYSLWPKYLGQDHNINKIIRPIKDDEKEFSKKVDEIIGNVHDFNGISEIVYRGAVKYMLFSNKNGLNYFPCEKRSAFLEESNLFNIAKQINRFEIIGTLDKEISKYHEELNKFFGKNIFSFEIPLLADYIIQNTPSQSSHIEYAIKLRKDKCVASYRKYLNEIEVAINNADWNKLNKFEQETKGLVRDIYEAKRLVDSISVNLFALPSFSISTTNLPFRRNVHLSFIRKLSRFAYQRNMIK